VFKISIIAVTALHGGTETVAENGAGQAWSCRYSNHLL